MIAVLAPGQGAQVPGMLSAWAELPGVTSCISGFGDLVDLDLLALGTTGSADDITDTAVTQPLLTAAGLIAAGQLGLLGDAAADGAEILVAGHSIGELAAAAVAGALTAADAIGFAGRRGAAMARACRLAPSSMAAVLGGEPATVLAAIEAAGCVPANRNGAGQIVAAGSVTAVATLVASPPAGARVRPLAVAGAFHTPFMAPAEAELAAWATRSLAATTPRRTLLSNADGDPVVDGNDLVRRLIAQVTRPVRWDLCMQAMARLGVTTIIELAPGGTLTGLAKRALKGVELIAIKTPSDLDAARAALGATS